MNEEIKRLELEELRARTRRLEAELAAAPRAESLNLRELERQAVQTALQQANGNKMHAAKTLGVSRRALYRLIAKYKLGETANGAAEPGTMGDS